MSSIVGILGFFLTPRMENRMEKNMEDQMEAGPIQDPKS